MIDPTTVVISNASPPIDPLNDGENRDDTNKMTGIDSAIVRSFCFGKEILPSINLAKSQKKNDIATPINTKNPFPDNKEICKNGKKNIGKKKSTTNKTKKEILSTVVYPFNEEDFLILS